MDTTDLSILDRLSSIPPAIRRRLWRRLGSLSEPERNAVFAAAHTLLRKRRAQTADAPLHLAFQAMVTVAMLQQETLLRSPSRKGELTAAAAARLAEIERQQDEGMQERKRERRPGKVYRFVQANYREIRAMVIDEKLSSRDLARKIRKNYRRKFSHPSLINNFWAIHRIMEEAPEELKDALPK